MILDWQIAPGTPDISDGPVEGQQQWRHCRIAVVSTEYVEAYEFIQRIYEGMTVGRNVILRREPTVKHEVDHETKQDRYTAVARFAIEIEHPTKVSKPGDPPLAEALGLNAT